MNKPGVDTGTFFPLPAEFFLQSPVLVKSSGPLSEVSKTGLRNNDLYVIRFGWRQNVQGHLKNSLVMVSI